LSVQDIQSSVATQIGAGQVTVLGTFTVIDWASSGTTTIDGGNITANTITTTQLNFTPATSTDIIATINASSEGIAITGDRISITGSTDFASGYDPTDKVAELGGQYNSAASGARVRIFPDANTGILVTDGTNDVFKTLVGGTDVGDVIIGDYSGGKGAKWDNSASTFDIQGTLTACTVGSGKTLEVIGEIECGNILIRGVGYNYIEMDGTYYTRITEGAVEVGPSSTSYTSHLHRGGISILNPTSGETYFQVINSSGYIYFTDAIIQNDVHFNDDIYCDRIYCNDIRLDSTGDISFDGLHLYRSGSDLYWNGTKLN